ncbi:hypothetical protein F8388_009210 [Cannabis sativa]|uniref:Uncharacterized protein n=1 Tax=Cannabis sativa TaxID=3483 RepID=A0A7J6GM50_CANSA|nr:hypothetical protein F8388_009210 [Cannabis sativa]
MSQSQPLLLSKIHTKSKSQLVHRFSMKKYIKSKLVQRTYYSSTEISTIVLHSRTASCLDFEFTTIQPIFSFEILRNRNRQYHSPEFDFLLILQALIGENGAAGETLSLTVHE